MKISILIQDASQQIVFRSNTKVDPDSLFEAAESRAPAIQQRGEKFALSGVPFFAKKVVAAAREQRLGLDIDKAVVEVAMMAWLYEHLFRGVSQDDFARSTLTFTVLPSGNVEYTRSSGSPAAPVH